MPSTPRLIFDLAVTAALLIAGGWLASQAGARPFQADIPAQQTVFMNPAIAIQGADGDYDPATKGGYPLDRGPRGRDASGFAEAATARSEAESRLRHLDEAVRSPAFP